MIDRLKEMLSAHRVGHAYIFNGREGSGKSTIAYLFAKWIMCQDESEDFYDKPCGKCNGCLMAEKGVHPDLSIISDGERASISIETIRQLQQHVNIRPLYANKKVYIIENGERMTVQAQNCLLKTFEDPYEYVTIIITTSNYQSLLETIRSRAVKYELVPNTQKQIKEALQRRNNNFNEEKINLACVFSNGALGRAISITESDKFDNLRLKAIDIANKLLTASLLERLECFEFFKQYSDEIDDVMQFIILWYRDLYMAKHGIQSELLINYDNRDIIFKKATELESDRLYRIIRSIEHTRYAIKGNVNFQLAIEYMLVTMGEEVA